MKKCILLISCLAFCIGGMTQGIEFQKGKSFKEVVAMAKEQGKWVFMDVYGTVCPPCRRMEKEVFPLPKVGEFYNDHFVCLKVNGQTEEQDLVSMYRATIWPTYLFFDGDGVLRHKVQGFLPADKFIAEGRKALAEADMKPYGEWLDKFLSSASSSTLSGFARAMVRRGISLAGTFERYWLTRQPEMLTSRALGQWPEECVSSLQDAEELVAKKIANGKIDRMFGLGDPVNKGTQPILMLGDMLIKEMVTLLQAQNVLQAKDYALRMKNRELFDYALSLWDALPASQRVGEREALELEFLQATGDKKAYVRQATLFLNRLAETVSRDSLLAKGKAEAALMPVWGIREEWRPRFEEMYCDLYFNYVDTIVRQCMAFSKSRKQLPGFSRWMDYAATLKPGSSRAAQLISDVRNWCM